MPPSSIRTEQHNHTTQIAAQQEKKQSPIFLGLPSLTQITARTSEAIE
ncbi:hypothetical protein OYE22_00120 [Streptomyces sp. 71268]|nr:hypothetical protein [Streptomyces sp. 71268]WEV23761.1 hypothetical protein OYE22_00120 [Streptomyces sp. 71268]